MDVAHFCRQTKVVIVAGKGGVGKTTVSAALARMAGMAGLTTLIVDLEGKSGLPYLFGHDAPLTYDEVVFVHERKGSGTTPASALVKARRLTPDDALLDYLNEHSLGRISKRLVNSGTLDIVATAVPGLRDILVLGKIKSLERNDPVDLIVVDAPATGHAVSALATAHGLVDAIQVGPIRVQSQDVIELLADPARCQVMLVTLPEETPVNEVVDAAFEMEERVGVNLGPVVVNSLYPELEDTVDATSAATSAGIALGEDTLAALDAAAAFRRSRRVLQLEQIRRLSDALPLPQLHLPHLFTTELGRAEVDMLAGALSSEVAQMETV